MGTEPGVKLDQDKIRFELVPPTLIQGVGEVLTFGAKKYTTNGWQTVDNAESRYMGALLRHINAYQQGEECDPESGLHHLKHAATNIAFLIHFKENQNTNK